MAQKFVDFFNRLTGKSHISLAYALNFLALMVGSVASVAMGNVFGNEVLFYSMLIVVLFAVYTILIINSTKKAITGQQIKRAKNFIHTQSLVWWRLGTGLLFLAVLLMYTTLVFQYGFPPMLLWFVGYSGIIPIIYYILSIEKPPYSTGRVWEKIKSFFATKVSVEVRITSPY